jgi:prophage endopeptidase
MTHLWTLMLATPMWLKLGVVCFVGACVAFPALLRWLIGTEAGRAVLLGGAAIIAICWFRADAYADGVAAERAAASGRTQAANLKAAQRELVLTTQARDAERKHAADLQAAASQFHEEMNRATTSRDRTIADLRSGALRLQRQWTCPTVAAGEAATGSAGADEDARLREQGAADLVRLLDEADAQVRGLQSTVTADRAVK